MSGGIPWCQVRVRGVPRYQGGHFRGARGSKAASGGHLEDPRESRVMSKVTHRIKVTLICKAVQEILRVQWGQGGC